MNKSIKSRTEDRAVTVGTGWRISREVVTVVAVTGANRLVVESADGERRSVRPGELEPPDPDAVASGAGRGRSADVSPEQWERARRMLGDLQGIGGAAECAGPEVAGLAAKWSVSRATVWRRIHRYRRENSLLACLDRRPGPLKGAPQLASESESVIGDVARRWWRQTDNATVAEIAPDVQAECKARGLPIPSRATIVRQLRATPQGSRQLHGRGAGRCSRERSRLT